MDKRTQSLVGKWTYRSFLNNPTPVNGDANAALALIFGEGELDISQADGAGFKASLSFGGPAVMDLAGTIEPARGDHPAVVRARGKGRAGSGIEDYLYDYLFYPVFAWPAGVGQRQAMVGTVMRAADHGSAKKGAVASSVTVRIG